jgi:hypothetical protein
VSRAAREARDIARGDSERVPVDAEEQVRSTTDAPTDGTDASPNGDAGEPQGTAPTDAACDCRASARRPANGFELMSLGFALLAARRHARRRAT